MSIATLAHFWLPIAWNVFFFLFFGFWFVFTGEVSLLHNTLLDFVLQSVQLVCILIKESNLLMLKVILTKEWFSPVLKFSFTFNITFSFSAHLYGQVVCVLTSFDYFLFLCICSLWILSFNMFPCYFSFASICETPLSVF